MILVYPILMRKNLMKFFLHKGVFIMKKYLNSQGTAYLWSKIKNIKPENALIYESKTVEEWNSDISLISQKGTLYIYSDYKMIVDDEDNEIFLPGLKIGDGKAYLIDLPFLNTGALDQQILDHINNNVIHVSLQDRRFWNEKLNYRLEADEQTLIFNRY